MSELNLETVVKDAVRKQIAADVVNSLDENAKEKIITNAVSDLLDSYKFRGNLEKAIEEESLRILHEYIQLPEVKEKIRMKTIVATEKFIDTFQQAFMVKLIGFFDKPGYKREYESPEFHRILKTLLGMKEEK